MAPWPPRSKGPHRLGLPLLGFLSILVLVGGQLPDSGSPLPASPSPLPASLSPVPASPSPDPASLSPVPAFPSPVPASVSPAPAPISSVPAPVSPLPAPFPAPAPQPVATAGGLPDEAALNASANAAVAAALAAAANRTRGAPGPAPGPALPVGYSNLTLAQILNSLNLRVPATLGVGALGVTYGRQQAQPLPFPQVVSLMLRNNITAIRFLDPPDAQFLEALANTGILVSIMVPNNYIVYLSTNPDAARNWVDTWVGQYIDRVKFKYVVVGDTPLRSVYNCYYCAALPLTVTNIQAALLELGLSTQVSVPLAADDVLDLGNGAWPPNSASFNPVLGPTLLLILKTAFESNANILVDFDPYRILQQNTSIPLNVALGTAELGDPSTFQLITGQNYTNLYDVYLDAIAYAATGFRFPTLNITISSTGWPTDGGSNATLANAQAYVNYVIRRALSTGGTPYRQSRVTELYLNEIIDEDLTQLNNIPYPDGWRRHMGLFTPQGVPKFAVDVRGTDAPPRPMNALQDLIRLPRSFCVAKPGVPDTALLIQQLQACSNGADCTAFTEGGSCFQPNTVAAHTSYAFNDYYQKHAQWSPACDFGGTAQLVDRDPSSGNCTFISGVGLPGYGVPGSKLSSGGEGRHRVRLHVGLGCLLLVLLSQLLG